MPTENRSSNTETVSVPHGWLYRINPDVPGSNWQFTQDAEHAERLARSENVEYVKIQAEQHQGEPVAWLYSRPEGQVEPVVTLDRASASDRGSWEETPLYTRANAGEVERLREAHTNLANLYGKQRLDLEQLQAKLAEREARLREIACIPGDSINYHATHMSRIARAALSASAEPQVKS